MKLFINDTTAFYKKKLYNRISERADILVIYTGYQCEGRNADFSKGCMNYPHIFLTGNKLKKIYQIYHYIKHCDYDELILGGWVNCFDWAASFISPKRKNSVTIESTIVESRTKGPKAWLKRLFLTRFTTAYVCGQAHAELTKALGFKGRNVLTKGVGLFNRISQPQYQPRSHVVNFLFVGRFIAEKNLNWLIRQFNNRPELQLTLIGFGKLENELKLIAKENIHFIGAVDNENLPEYYQRADVFILPSLSETWGVVVEEALNNGTPVMVSDRVGCAKDLVNNDTGVVFSLNNKDFEEKLMEIRDLCRYNEMRFAISRLDFEKMEQEQINCYLN
jgi:glycosyltransferase involved in cell wall biosynthesis